MHLLSGPVSSWALTGIIVASGLGAILMCLLVLLSGSPRRTWDRPASADRGRGATVLLLGHAAAGVCFAIAVILAVVLFAHQARSAAAMRASGGPIEPAGGADVDGLSRTLTALEARVARAETLAADTHARLGTAAERLQATAGRVEAAESQAGAASTTLTELRSRLDAADARVTRIEGQLQGVESSAREAGRNATTALSGLRQVEQRLAVASSPAPSRLPALSERAPSAVMPITSAPSTRRTPARQERAPATSPRAETPSPTASPSATPRTEPPSTAVAPAPERPATVNSIPSPTPGRQPGSPGQEARLSSPHRERVVPRQAPEPESERTIAERFRDDWATIKREAHATNSELRRAWQKFRDFITK